MRRLLRNVGSVAVAAVLLAGLQAVAQPLAPANAATTSWLGVYVGAGSPSQVADYERWIGTPVPWALDFIAGGDWKAIDDPSWWLGRWSGSGRQVVYSAPMLPSSSYTLAAGAQGAYNDHWKKFAQTFVAKGDSDAVIRIGWEFNGRYYPWKAGGNEDAFAAYWRQIVTTMRSVSGAQFRFDWAPMMGATGADVERAYPGDAYVDVIGLDAYDQSAARPDLDPAALWNNTVTRKYGLQWHRNFAAAHNKPVSFPEWGLSIHPTKTTPTNEDNDHYIRSMRDWFGNSRLAYAMYFERDASDWHHKLTTGRFPKGAAAFKSAFALIPQATQILPALLGADSSSSPTPTTAPVTTTTAAPVPTTVATTVPTTVATTEVQSSPSTLIAASPSTVDGGTTEPQVTTTVLPTTTTDVVAATSTIQTIFGAKVPTFISADTRAVELGVKFRAAKDGTIHGIRFFKAAGNGGVHVASLWTKNGKLLAQVPFNAETASGWQQVRFPASVDIVRGTTYIASYHTTRGRYAADRTFTESIRSGDLVALRSGFDGLNGVYAYSSTPTFPVKGSRKQMNYWVDVLFTSR